MSFSQGGFAPYKGEVNGFNDQRFDSLDRDNHSCGSGFYLPSCASGDMSSDMSSRESLPIHRKGKGKGKKGGSGRNITITSDDVPDFMPIRCSFCHQRGHHITLCLAAFKDRLEKVESHCQHGFHKPWYHDGAECRCRYCGIHLRQFDKDV